MADTLPPTVVTAQGMQPLQPSDIRNQLITNVAATNPGYTATLPGSLIEDIASTDVGAILLCDTARVETVNSLTPYGANVFTLGQLGTMLGIQPGVATNTSVEVVFTGTAGYVVPPGFIVSDGTYQYVIQDGVVIGTFGNSDPVLAVATIAGTWAVPANTVTQLVTSVPGPGTFLSGVNNPLPGAPGVAAETEWGYRARVLQANLAASTGMERYLKTLILNVPGTVQRLVSVRTRDDGVTREVIVGGGDDYAVAYAIWSAIPDTTQLRGSELRVTNISTAEIGIVTTNLAHGYSTDQTVTLSNVVGMTQVNGVPYVITVLTPFTFSIPANTIFFNPYVSGGDLNPNLRDTFVSIQDYPDTYTIPIVRPPQQVVTITANWGTSLPNFTGAQAVAQLVPPAIQDYINAIAVGQPIITYLLEQVFTTAVQNVIAPQFLVLLDFDVSINGVSADPQPGTGEILSDPESYFFAGPASVTVVQQIGT